MPGKGVAVDIESGIGGIVNIGIDGSEIHVAIAIHAACHLHGIAGNSFGEVGVNQLIERTFLIVVIDGCTGTKFEVGVLQVINILLKSLLCCKPNNWFIL